MQLYTKILNRLRLSYHYQIDPHANRYKVLSWHGISFNMLYIFKTYIQSFGSDEEALLSTTNYKHNIHKSYQHAVTCV